MCSGDGLVVFSTDVMHVISNEATDGDNEVLWRHDMLSDIVYACTNEGAMLDRLDMMLLLSNKSMKDRFDGSEKTDLRRIFQARNQSKSFKNSMSEVLPDRMLVD